MSSSNEVRYVGIIADGGTDRAILARTAETCIGATCRPIELRRQSLRDTIDEYWKKQDDGAAAQAEVTRAVIGVLYTALGEFEARLSRPVSAADVLILSTDAERHFKNEGQYFDAWAWSLISAVYLGIERFIHAQLHTFGRGCDLIPAITLFVPFPSTEILVAAVRGEAGRGRRALELKQSLYNTTTLLELGPDELADLALDYITADSLREAFRIVPEIRVALRTMGFCL